MFRKKTLAAVLAVLLVTAAAVGFVGCKKKSTSGTSSAGRRGGFNVEEMEQRYKSGLAELVSAGTITQAQSDKIYTALTERLSFPSGGSRPSGSPGEAPFSRPSGASGGPQEEVPSGAGSRPEGAPSGGGGEGRGGGFGSQALQSLVSDGTITQAQADAVIQKLMGNFRGGGESGDSASSAASQ